MTAVLSDRYRYHVAYQCQSCNWGGLVALGLVLTNAEIWRLFSCPVHGVVGTSIKTMDTRLLEAKQKSSGQ